MKMPLVIAYCCFLFAPAVALAQPSLPALSLLGQSSMVRAQTAGEEQAQLDRLMELVVALPPDIPDNPFRAGRAPRVIPAPRRLTAEEKDILKALEARGTLKARASDGETVLSHLVALAYGTPAQRSTMSGSALFVDLIRMLRPTSVSAAMRQLAGGAKGAPLDGGLGAITQCGVHYTCGAASIQVWMRINRPAELVRITRRLFCEGRAALDGGTLKPARNSMLYHAGDRIFSNERFTGDEGSEDRCDLDILLQSALMDEVAIGNWSAYDVYADCGGGMNAISGNSGSHPKYIARTLEQLTGRAFDYQWSLAGKGAGEMVDRAVSRLRAGQPVVILYNTNPDKKKALHYVTAVSWDDGADALCYVDTCETKATGAKLYRMTRAELLRSLRGVIHPEG